jgi:hypothetical protein
MLTFALRLKNTINAIAIARKNADCSQSWFDDTRKATDRKDELPLYLPGF